MPITTVDGVEVKVTRPVWYGGETIAVNRGNRSDDRGQDVLRLRPSEALRLASAIINKVAQLEERRDPRSRASRP